MSPTMGVAEDPGPIYSHSDKRHGSARKIIFSEGCGIVAR